MPSRPNPAANAPAVLVDGLTKVYRVAEREAGVRASLKSLFRRRTRNVVAVDHVHFSIDPGEVVGFLGPNGAGKTTTIKMLGGLLHPTSGNASVLGHQPWQRERELLRQIALLMGNRQQLNWDIPAIDSFEMLRTVYRVPRDEYHRTLAQLTALLQLDPLLRKPVRQLSLGERMKVEMAAALLHMPRLLFLDEPTLGLDVSVQRRIRQFIAEYNERTGATVLLTSHYMADIEALCKRVVVIHHGRIQYDGELVELARSMSSHKTITVRCDAAVMGVDVGEEACERALRKLLSAHGDVTSVSGAEATLHVDRTLVRQSLGALLELPEVIDFNVEDPPLEAVIERVFADGIERVMSTSATNGAVANGSEPA